MVVVVDNRSSKIKVCVRIRPLVPHEEGESTRTLLVEEEGVVVRSRSSSPNDATPPSKRFKFHKVFNQDSTQREVGDALLPDLSDAFLEGFHCTIFAYGQTGSGKSFTMEGYQCNCHVSKGPKANTKVSIDDDRLGLTPRAIKLIYDKIQAARSAQMDEGVEGQCQYNVKCSFLQLYNEQIIDLLNTSTIDQQVYNHRAMRGGLKLRWCTEDSFYVENLFMVDCGTAEEALEQYARGVNNKVMASHNMNATSSRSHCLFTIYLERRGGLDEEAVVKSRFTLVDLAGSERVSQTGATGKTLQESIGINKSLFVLRQVIQALADPTSQEKPCYRDSKLTCLLKHSLGGNSHTVMVACLSPADTYLAENISTLTYAARAQSIINTPLVNLDERSQLIASLRLEVARLKKELKCTQVALLTFQTSGTSTEARQNNSNGDKRSMPSTPTIAQAGEGRPPSSKEEGKGVNHEDDDGPDGLSVTRLKKELVDIAVLLRHLVESESALQSRLQVQQAVQAKMEREQRCLHNENQELREKVEMLEYLVGTCDHPDEAHRDPITYLQGHGASQHIPDYGETQSTYDAPLPDLSMERHEAMKKQIAMLQFQNNLLKQEMEGLRQASTDPATNTANPSSSAQPVTSKGLCPSKALNPVDTLPALPTPAPASIIKRSAGANRLKGLKVSMDVKSRHEEVQLEKYFKRQDKNGPKPASATRAPRCSGALSLYELKSLLKRGGSADTTTTSESRGAWDFDRSVLMPVASSSSPALRYNPRDL